MDDVSRMKPVTVKLPVTAIRIIDSERDALQAQHPERVVHRSEILRKYILEATGTATATEMTKEADTTE